MAACVYAGVGAERSAAICRTTKPRRTRVVTRAQAVKPLDQSANSSGDADIYVGKGRYMKGDPKKYPGKESLGVFTGATGGWAGGETALWNLRTEYESSKGQKEPKVAAKPTVPKVNEQGKAAIYLGKPKIGGEPRYIVDDPRKYPGREDVAIFSGMTGGFAGGEKGLKQFVENGELSLRPPSMPSANSQYSPLTIAGLLIAAGAGGGLLLNSALLAGKGLVAEEMEQVAGAAIDDNTKSLLSLALLLLGAAVVVGGTRAAMAGVQQRIRQGAERLLAVTGFWVAVLLIASAVLVA